MFTTYYCWLPCLMNKLGEKIKFYEKTLSFFTNFTICCSSNVIHICVGLEVCLTSLSLWIMASVDMHHDWHESNKSVNVDDAEQAEEIHCLLKTTIHVDVHAEVYIFGQKKTQTES
ncbi:uncharacterized protein LOC134234682 [Saccostrea cucullata]|uniref:uncharacterized protein LOC134234682 n=1 Tax=Saccostrea cuccullata TaxID=36930 RepID=UPI002ED0FF5F